MYFEYRSIEPGGYLQCKDVEIGTQHLVRISETCAKPTQGMIVMMSKLRSSSVFKYLVTGASISGVVKSVYSPIEGLSPVG